MAVPLSSEKLVAREYLRVSVDRSGRARSNAEQHDDFTRDAERQGWRLHPEPYADTVSASRYSSKRRDGFEALTADLAADRFGAQVLALWEVARGGRREGDWVGLVELCERRSVQIWISTHGRLYDPANPRDRRSLLEDAIDAAYESAKTSGRVRRAAAANAVQGKPHGRVNFGFRREYDPRTGRLLAQVPDETTAPLVREVFGRFLAGEPLRRIAMDFEARGIVNGRSKPHSQQALRNLLVTPAYAGLRAHNPGRQGVRGIVEGSTKLVAAEWSGLVTPADFWQVQEILSDPARVTRRGGRAEYLLSGVVPCDSCGAAISVRHRRGQTVRAEYRCGAHGCATIAMVDLDALVVDLVTEYLARDDVYEALAAAQGAQGEELSRVRDELATVRAEALALADSVGRGELSVSLAARAEPRLLSRVAELEQRERELVSPGRLAQLLPPGPDVRARWERLEIPARREVLRILLVPGLIGELRLIPNPAKNRKLPAHERVRIVTNTEP